MFRSWALGLLAAAALAGRASLDADSGVGGVAPGTLVLELGYGSEPRLDLPLSLPDVNADTTQAIQEIEAGRKADALGRASRPDPTRRPDLDHDVTQDIQSRGLDRSIGR